MDFLGAAAVLIPALAGIEVTLCDESPDALAQFECRYCFSPQLQGIYSAIGLGTFLNKIPDDSIYDLVEPLGSCLTVFRAGARWALLGPYVEEGWSESAARVLLTGLGAAESVVTPYKAYRCKLPIARRDYVIKTALLIAERTDGAAFRQVKTIHVDAERWGPDLTIPDAYHDISIINERYAKEERFITAVSRGETEAAVGFMSAFKEVSSDLRFMSNDLNDQITGAAIVRTLIRMGGRRAGLSAVCIDSISQEYAQKMKHTVSADELIYLQRRMVERICAEVRSLQEDRYPPCARRAMDYMTVNLSQPLTVEEIARAAGVDRHCLSKDLIRETGKTVKQYLAMRRCEVAAELLLDSSASIQEIAAYVGYVDANYFSKVFKADRGVPPQVYRDLHGTLLKTE